MRFEILIEPMGAVRTTQRAGGKTEAGQRYVAYKEYIALKMQQHAIIKEPLTGAIGIPLIVFTMPIPKSKAGKVVEGQLHTVKPDIDNLIKGLFDAANGIAWVDDNRVASIGAVKKIYGEQPGIYFEVEEIGELVHGQVANPEPSIMAKRKPTKRPRRNIRRPKY